jgi:hypothetical protein
MLISDLQENVKKTHRHKKILKNCFSYKFQQKLFLGQTFLRCTSELKPALNSGFFKPHVDLFQEKHIDGPFEGTFCTF